jgi:hypothetical protein
MYLWAEIHTRQKRSDQIKAHIQFGLLKKYDVINATFSTTWQPQYVPRVSHNMCHVSPTKSATRQQQNLPRVAPRGRHVMCHVALMSTIAT